MLTIFKYADDISDLPGSSALRISPEMYSLDLAHLEDCPKLNRKEFDNFEEEKSHQRYIVAQRMDEISTELALSIDELIGVFRKLDAEMYADIIRTDEGSRIS